MKPSKPLTPAEKELLIELLDSTPMKEIAFSMKKSTKTIDTQAARIYAKYGVQNRLELIINHYKDQVKELSRRINPTDLLD